MSNWWETNILTGQKVNALEVLKTKPLPVVGGGIGTKMFGVAGGGAGLASTTIPKLPWSGIAAIGGGALAGFGLSSIFGGKKSEQKQELGQTQQSTQITKTYAPVTTITNTYTNAPTYMYQIDSPYGTQKKADVLTSEPNVGVSPAYNLSPSQATSQSAEQGQSQGTDMIMLAAIAAVGLVAYGYVSKRKS